MGGTFSPIHYGHLLMAEHIREEFNLSKIIFVPAKRPPHKDIARIIEAQDRLHMVRLAIHDNPDFEISEIELNREGASYTVDTLKEFKKHYGPADPAAVPVAALAALADLADLAADLVVPSCPKEPGGSYPSAVMHWL